MSVDSLYISLSWLNFWQGGEPNYHMAWVQICEISRKEFHRIYRRLGVHLEEKVCKLFTSGATRKLFTFGFFLHCAYWEWKLYIIHLTKVIKSWDGFGASLRYGGALNYFLKAQLTMPLFLYHDVCWLFCTSNSILLEGAKRCNLSA